MCGCTGLERFEESANISFWKIADLKEIRKRGTSEFGGEIDAIFSIVKRPKIFGDTSSLVVLRQHNTLKWFRVPGAEQFSATNRYSDYE